MKHILLGVPQDLVSDAGPMHCPLQGPLIHCRVRVIVPLPHWTEHALQAPNAEYRAATK